MTQISAIVIFHREGSFAIPALQSLRDGVEKARQSGLDVEAIAILDRPDARTSGAVKSHREFFSRIDEADFGDLGLSRNFAAERASGDFLAFFDGDDLWGADWLTRAHACAASQASPQTIWHPEWLYAFSESDWDRHARGAIASPDVMSYFLRHTGTADPEFHPGQLLFCNLWSANAFAARDLFLDTPYQQVRRDIGFGIEDWSWNLETVGKGIPHLVVPHSVHIIRLKDDGSLNAQNLKEGLLPWIPDGFVRPSQGPIPASREPSGP